MSELVEPSSPSPWNNLHLIPSNDDINNIRKNTRVTIIGAGFIGISTAYFMNKLGYNVTVVDKRNECGSATSHACGNVMALNRSWPMAQPSNILPSIRNAFKGWFKKDDDNDKNETVQSYDERPLIFDKKPPKNKLIVPSLRWGFNFIEGSRPNSFRLGVLTMYSMAVHSQISVKNIITKYKMPLDVIYGHTCVYTTPEAFKKDREIYNNLEVRVRLTKRIKDAAPIMKTKYEVLSPTETLNRVPTLRAIGVDENMIVGGLYSPFSLTTSAHSYLMHLEKICKNEGVQFMYNTEIIEVEQKKNFFQKIDISKLKTNNNDIIESDYVIFCTGPETQPLLKSLNIKGHVPIVPLVGHSLSATPTNIDNKEINDQHSFSIMPQGLYINQVNDEIRMTQGASLGVDIEYDDTLCQYLLDAFRKLYYQDKKDITFDISKNLINKSEREANKIEMWVGGRPLTPDTRPIIGFLPHYNNIMINAGHGMLGWTFSAISGELAAFILDSRVNMYENQIIGPRVWINALDPCRFMLYQNVKKTMKTVIRRVNNLFGKN